ncbi:type I DNA topoisomerase [Candidatus Peregrinibacteria bacterium]|jgi:DNA topoisomerase I|nr:type I DNA topoisomerase [Candidatus Peregrinibacteria bacterium]
MAKNLVIVESPAKAKTISRFLGKDYKVLASMGHVRDLPKSKMGIDVDKDFAPSYMVSADKKKVVKQLVDEYKKADHLWLATDEDREGEAIGWHLLSALKVKKQADVKRIVFHEITEGAIKGAMEEPRSLDMNVVDAQQARRVLDRLVGYELSPLLWKKIRYGLSAGRVQSVAVRLVVDREREIEAFKPEEYWSVIGHFEKEDKALKERDKKFEAKLHKISKKEAIISDEKSAKKALADLKGAEYEVTKVDKKQTKRNPTAPFITSTLQQEASRKLHFSVKKTMMVAQQLYEGIDLGKGESGLITYMRTDSVNLSNVALKDAKDVITKEFGKEYALDTPRKFKGKKGAQEAHEAIRPVNLALHPDEAKNFLSNDQFRLYEIIWKRTIACQMKEVLLDKTSVDVEAMKGGEEIGYQFRATGQVVRFPGFMEVYMEGKDTPEEEDSQGDKFLPSLEEGEKVDLDKLVDTQHFTKPPARYTEASLVKKLESEGIGRPSTYAPTIHTVVTRGYIEKEQKTLRPTDLAMVVTDMLVKHFSDIVDYKFTAEMEEKLDGIEEGKHEWVPMIKEFYVPFHKAIEEKSETIKRDDLISDETDEVCEKCGNKMMVKLGRFGKFLSCSNYPECKNAKPMEGAEGPQQQEETPEFKKLKEKFKDKKCEKCGEPMEAKMGPYGPFLGCSKYPECKNIQSIVVFSGVKCPTCETGQLVERRTRKGGRIFWGCNKFPKCKTATWNKPVEIDKKTGKLKVEDKEGNVVFQEDTVKKKPAAKKKAAAKPRPKKKPAKKK